MTTSLRFLRRTSRPCAAILAAILRRTGLVGLIAVAASCTCASGALAAGGPLVHAGADFGGGTPVVAVDAAGTAYVAWPQGPAFNTIPTKIAYCTIPAGDTACTSQGELTPAGTTGTVEHLALVVDGPTVVLTAVMYLAGAAYLPLQEWTTADGTTSFTQVDSGEAIDNVPGYGDNAVVLPGTSYSLGQGFGEVGYNSANFAVWTGKSSLSDPPVCSDAACPTKSYAVLNSPSSTFVSQEYSDWASRTETGEHADPGVLGVFDSPDTLCPGNSGASFIYGSGAQSASNSYAIDPGDAKSAWKTIAQLDCSGYNPAVGGGPSGFGELEWDGANYTMVYQPFDQSSATFGAPVTIGSEEDALGTSLSQDAAGGVYATWYDQYAPGGPAIRFAYSPNGGASWEGPVSLTGGTAHPEDVSSAVGADGQGWAVSTEIVEGSPEVFVQPFVKGDAYVAPSGGGKTPSPSPSSSTIATSQTSGSTKGADISIVAGTVGETDQATIAGANAAQAGGTVRYDLYASPTCDPGVSLVFEGGTSPVVNGVVGPSLPVTTALSPGKYYWQAIYSGDALDLPVTSPCGSEVLDVTPAATGASSGTSNGSTVTVTVTCQASTTCEVTVTILATEVTVTVKASAAKHDKRKQRTTRKVTLASGSFKVSAGHSKRLTLRLSKAGKKLLAKDHGHLKGTIAIADKSAHGVTTTQSGISIATHRTGRHK